jgi:hypothetical protein
MQAPAIPRLPLPPAAHAATPLLRPLRPTGPIALPLFPPAWQLMPLLNRLRHEDGREVRIHLIDSTVDLPRVAWVTLGTFRVAVHSAGDRCEARWTAARKEHRLSAEPTTLADFMDLLFSLIWA